MAKPWEDEGSLLIDALLQFQVRNFIKPSCDQRWAQCFGAFMSAGKESDIAAHPVVASDAPRLKQRRHPPGDGFSRIYPNDL